jgi:predicted acetyltransferase
MDIKIQKDDCNKTNALIKQILQENPNAFNFKDTSDTVDGDCYQITLKDDPIGFILLQSIDVDIPEIQFGIMEKYQKRGYGSQAICKFHSILKDLGHHEVFAVIKRTNEKHDIIVKMLEKQGWDLTNNENNFTVMEKVIIRVNP